VVIQHLSFSEEVAAYDRFDKRVEVFMKVILNPSRSAVLSSRVARSYVAIWLLNHLQLDVEGLYRVFTIALVLFAYGLTAILGGSGFLAVYLVGFLLGNSSVQRVDRLSRFHDGIA
jgi:NhaP-type Na+/H+ and K+/H+ antiporter